MVNQLDRAKKREEEGKKKKKKREGRKKKQRKTLSSGRAWRGARGGLPMSEDHRQKIAAAARRRYAGQRRRDLEDQPGLGVYSTSEYQEARNRLVVGRPCIRCGATEEVHAHHERPGDDESLVPVCSHCHPTEHATL